MSVYVSRPHCLATHRFDAARVEPRVRTLELDIDAHLELATRHAIRSVPTLELFGGGKEIARSREALNHSERPPAMNGRLANHARKCLIRRSRVQTCAGLGVSWQVHRGAMSAAQIVAWVVPEVLA